MQRFKPVTVRISSHSVNPSILRRLIGSPNAPVSGQTSTLMLTPAVTTGHVMSMDELANVKGRGWEDIDVSGMHLFLICSALQTLTPRSIDYACKRHGKRSSGTPLMHAGTARLDLPVLTCSETRVTTFSARPDPSTGLEGRSLRLPDKHRCRNGISIH